MQDKSVATSGMQWDISSAVHSNTIQQFWRGSKQEPTQLKLQGRKQNGITQARLWLTH